MIAEDKRTATKDKLKKLLKNSSREIWNMKTKNDYYDYYAAYINELLPDETEYIRTYGYKPEKTGGTLVYLVGYSLEPLILTICLRKPDDVILIMNKEYGENTGEGYYREVASILELLQDKHQFKVLPFQRALNSDSPDDVFSYLQTYCSELENVYIDITGGKKSMISGAFFYAAYSDTPITYVDFEEYDSCYEKPYGYSCQFADLPNPMEKFSLREWEDVKNLYERYSFGSALEIIRSLRSLGSNGLSRKEIESIQSLENVIKLYEYWNYSDYEKAKELIKKQDVKVPYSKLPSILEKFTSWNIEIPIEGMDYLLESRTEREIVKNFGDKIYKNMFTDATLLYFYINDEIHKVGRLISYAGDFRSAILKAASISEILMRMRAWIIADAVVITGSPRVEGFKLFISSIEMNTLLRIFKREGAKTRYYRTSYSLSIDCEHKCLSLQKKKLMNPGEQDYIEFHRLLDKVDKLALVRNKVVHGFMPASRSLAEKAHKISLASAEEFFEGWMSKRQREAAKDGTYEIIPWSELREICQLYFITEVK